MCYSFASFFFQQLVTAARSRSPPRRRSIPKVRSYVPTIDRHLLRNKAKSYPRYRYDTTGTVDIINIMHTTRSICTGRSTKTAECHWEKRDDVRRGYRPGKEKRRSMFARLLLQPLSLSIHYIHSATCSMSWSRDRRGLIRKHRNNSNEVK